MPTGSVMVGLSTLMTCSPHKTQHGLPDISIEDTARSQRNPSLWMVGMARLGITAQTWTFSLPCHELASCDMPGSESAGNQQWGPTHGVKRAGEALKNANSWMTEHHIFSLDSFRLRSDLHFVCHRC